MLYVQPGIEHAVGLIVALGNLTNRAAAMEGIIGIDESYAADSQRAVNAGNDVQIRKGRRSDVIKQRIANAANPGLGRVLADFEFRIQGVKADACAIGRRPFSRAQQAHALRGCAAGFDLTAPWNLRCRAQPVEAETDIVRRAEDRVGSGIGEGVRRVAAAGSQAATAFGVVEESGRNIRTGIAPALKALEAVLLVMIGTAQRNSETVREFVNDQAAAAHAPFAHIGDVGGHWLKRSPETRGNTRASIIKRRYGLQIDGARNAARRQFG